MHIAQIILLDASLKLQNYRGWYLLGATALQRRPHKFFMLHWQYGKASKLVRSY
jgi:hypothetical protein